MDVRLPDGTIIRNVPEGVTKSQLMARVAKLPANAQEQDQAQQMMANREPERAETGKLSAAISGASQGLTAGFGDELLAGLTAPAMKGIDKVQSMVTGREAFAGKGIADIYRDERDKTRKQSKQAAEDEPLSYGAGYIAGAVASPAKFKGGVIQQGAKYGALASLGESEADSIGGMAADTAKGAALGAGTGAVLKATGKVAKPVAEKSISGARKAAVEAMRRIGIDDLTPGQLTGNRALKTTEAVMDDMLPTAGAARAKKEGQLRKFTAAALRKAGIEADEITPAVREQAEAGFNEAYRQMTTGRTITLDEPVTKAITEIEQRAVDKLPTTVKPIIKSYIKDIKNAGGKLTGEAYQEARSNLTSQARALAVNDPFSANTLRTLRNALDEAAERSLPASERGAWRALNNKYRNYKVIQSAATSASQDSLEGLLSPAALLRAVETANKTKSQKGYGQLYDLARSGKLLLADSIPSSGTAERQLAQRILTLGAQGAGIGGATYVATGDPGTAALATAGGLFAAPKLAQKALNSRAAQSYFTQGLPGASLLTPGVKGGMTRALGMGSGAAAASERPAQAEQTPNIAQPTAQPQPTEPVALTPLPPQSNANALLDRIAQAESSGNPNARNTNSTASGLYQFTDDTWTRSVAKWGKELGVGLRDKNNPEAQALMAERLMADNARILQKETGMQPTDGMLYAAHFLGASDAAKLIRAQGTGRQAVTLFPRKVVNSNRSIFFDRNRPRTVEEVYAILENKVSI